MSWMFREIILDEQYHFREQIVIEEQINFESLDNTEVTYSRTVSFTQEEIELLKLPYRAFKEKVFTLTTTLHEEDLMTQPIVDKEDLKLIIDSLMEQIEDLNVMADSVGIKEIHQALEAGNYAWDVDDPDAPRWWNLGKQIEAIANVLGLQFNPDGTIRSVRQSKFIPQGGTIPAGWSIGQWGRNEGGNREGQPGGQENETRYGLAYPVRSARFDSDPFTGDPQNIDRGGYVLVECIPQLLAVIMDDLDHAIGLQDAGAMVIPSSDGSNYAFFQGLTSFLAELLYTSPGGDQPDVHLNIKAPPKIPPRQLPEEEDNQTDTKTSPSRSISVKKALTSREYGKLICHPFTPEATINKAEFNPKPIKDTQQIGLQKWSTYVSGQLNDEAVDLKINLWDCALTLLPGSLRAATGEMGLLFGLAAIHKWQQEYSKASYQGFSAPSGLIPLKYKHTDYKPTFTTTYKEAQQPYVPISRGRLKTIHSLLGGSFWKDPNKTFKLEEDIEELAKTVFWDKDKKEYKENEVKIKSLFDYLRYILAGMYWKEGLHNLPNKVPESLLSIKTEKEDRNINSSLDYFDWFVDQVDSLVGEWPIKIDIEDADPIKGGKQKQEIILPNIGEAIAEIWGLQREAVAAADVNQAILTRLVPEVLAVKNGVIVTQDHARGISAYLGYRGNTKKRKVQCNFDVYNLTSISKMLQNREMYVVGWENQDKNTVAEYLEKLMFSAGIIKQAFFRPADQLKELTQIAENLGKGKNSDFDSDWEEFLKILKNNSSNFNKNAIPKPKVVKDYSKGN